MPSYSVTSKLLADYGLTPGRRRGYVLAAPVVAHVLALEELGWTYERTSKTAGLATCSVRQMLRQQNELIMARRAVAIMQIPLERFVWKSRQHGQVSTYRIRACRCDPCRKANSDELKQWRRERNGRTRLMDAEPVRRRLQDAIDCGLTTWSETHRAIGGSRRTLTMLLAGRYLRLRQPTVRRINAHLGKVRKRHFVQYVDLCLVCGWPLAEHRPYYVHIEPTRTVEQISALEPPQTHCQAGHEFTDENTRWKDDRRPGRTARRRECISCARERSRAWANQHPDRPR